jgi:sec-independent protein translocase protein TatA
MESIVFNFPIAAIGLQELLPIILVILLLFGVKRLPEMFKGLGQGLKEFRKAARELNEDDEETAAIGPGEDAADTEKPVVS